MARSISLDLPLAGLNRGAAYQKQPPYSTPACLNCQPFDTQEGRSRIGKRAGFVSQYFTDQISGASHPVRMLASIQVAPKNTVVTSTDNFKRTKLGDGWGAYTGALTSGYDYAGGTLGAVTIKAYTAGHSARTAIIDTGYVLCPFVKALKTENNAGNIRSSDSFTLSTYDSVTIGCTFSKSGLTTRTSFDNRELQSYAFAALTFGDYETGVNAVGAGRTSELFIRLHCQWNTGKTRVSYGYTRHDVLDTAVGGKSITYTTTDFDFLVKPLTCSILVDYTLKKITFKIGDESHVLVDVAPATLITDIVNNLPGRYGMMFRPARLSTASTQLGYFRADDFVVDKRDSTIVGSNAHTRRDMLVASANGELWVEKFTNGKAPGVMEKSTQTCTLSSTTHIPAISRDQKLYILDNEPDVLHYSDGVLIKSGTEWRLSSASVADFTTFSFNKNDHVVVLSDCATNNVNQTFKITDIKAGYLVLDFSRVTTALPISAPAVSYACAYRVTRGPKVYDFDTDTLSLWMSTDHDYGQIPCGCTMLTRYNDRACMSGHPDSPNVFYQCRIGDWNDWNYGATEDDQARAVAGGGFIAGEMAEPIKCQIPHSDDYFIFGLENSMFVLSGDLTFGGEVSQISSTIGVVGPDAWCKGPSNETYVLTKDGLASVQAGRSYPSMLSKRKLPMALINLDESSKYISLEYDFERVGIIIHITDTSGYQAEHYLYDIRTDSFWPVFFKDGSINPTCKTSHPIFGVNKIALYGCLDGRIRNYSRNANVDAPGVGGVDVDIESYFTIGPIGNGFDSSMLESINVLSDPDACATVVSVYSGDTNEEVIEQAEQDAAEGTDSRMISSETIDPGAAGIFHCRVSGRGILVKLMPSEDTTYWSIDSVTGVLEKLDRVKVL